MMKPRLEADWLTWPACQAVMAALDAPDKGASRYVGGCVRNTLMGRPVDDIDIATQLLPEQVVKALEAAGLKAIPTGIDHGTVTGIVDHRPVEITSLRRDVETDGRRAVVAFTRDWAEDARRRDFRLNAIYADAGGTLFDPTGGGLADAAAGRVIFIGDADERLREDYLRILRFFRFNAWYGAEIDPEGLAASTRQRDGLAKIAAERIWKEFRKLLGAPNPSTALDAMRETGILEAVLGADWGGVQRTMRLIEIETVLGMPADPIRRFMTLVPGHGDAVAELTARLRLSNMDRDRLLAWAEPDLPVIADGADPSLGPALYRYGAEAVLDRALIEAARGSLAVSTSLVEACQIWTRPVFPLKGADLLAVGLAPGPAVGDFLGELEAWWIAADFRPSKNGLLAELERRLKKD